MFFYHQISLFECTPLILSLCYIHASTIITHTAMTPATSNETYSIANFAVNSIRHLKALSEVPHETFF